MRRVVGRASFVHLALLALLPVLAFWPLTLGSKVLYWGTPLLQFYPWRQLAREAYLSGQVPLWNPYLGGGAPLAANLQSAVFYPPNALFLIFPVEQALGYSLVLHVALAGVLTYALGRRLGLAGPGAFLAALTYMFGGPLIARAGFLSMVSTAAWLPLLFLAVEVTLGRPAGRTRAAGPGLLAIAVAAPLLGGHAQLWYYALWAGSLYGLYRGVVTRAGPLDWVRLGLGAAAGLGLSAVQLLPTAELASLSVRSDGAPHDFAMAYSLWPWQVLGVIAPDLFGHPGSGDYWGPGAYWEATAYVGILPLLLLAPGIRGWRAALRRGEPYPFFIVLAVAAVLLALGRYLPFYPLLFRYVPGFGLFQAPARFLYFYAFAVALLAGRGLDALSPELESSRRSRLARVLAGAGLGTLAAVLAIRLLPAQQTVVRLTFLEALVRTGAVFAILGAILQLPLAWVARGARLAGRPDPGRLTHAGTRVVLLLVVATADLVTFAIPLHPVTDATVYTSGEPPAAAFLREQSEEGRFRVYTPDRSFLDKFFHYLRLDGFGPSDPASWLLAGSDLMPDTAASLGVEELYNYDPLQVERSSRLWQAIDASGLESRLLAVANVRYVLADEVPSDGGLTLAFAEGARIYEIRPHLPRAYVVRCGLWARDGSQALQLLQEPSFDPSTQAVLEGLAKAGDAGAGGWSGGGLQATLSVWRGLLQPAQSAMSGASGQEEAASCPPPGGGDDEQGGSGVEIKHYGAQQVSLVVQMSQPGYLVLSDTYYPGWRAWVESKEAPIYRANYAFRALELPAGIHRVEFRYDPISFRLGLGISLATAALLVGLFALTMFHLNGTGFPPRIR